LLLNIAFETACTRILFYSGILVFNTNFVLILITIYNIYTPSVGYTS
jgi:hypothetical protein